jgi:hypothetical protein
MICNHAGIGELCAECPHGKIHERTRHCNYSKCMVYAIAFGEKNKSCLLCELRKDCLKYDELINGNLPFINLLIKGEDCPQYNKLFIHAKCQ